jgi:site-specific recombinase XerD
VVAGAWCLMAWIRQLPSGLWAGTVYTPSGRVTESDPLKGRIQQWAADLEADVRRGEFVDPRLAKKTVGECWEKFEPSRRVEKASRARDHSHWRTWVAPRWAQIPVGSILKPDVQTWVNQLEEQGVGGWTIIAALNVLKATLELAVDAGWIRSNPARRVRPPMPPMHEDRVIDPEEERLILDRLDELFPGRRDARLFVECMFETGGRWEEVAAVRREAVNLRAGLIAFGPVMERDGTVRDYPKGARSRHAAGFRDVPIGTDLLGRLRSAVLATPAGGLVFTAPAGGSLLYPTWLDRVWNLAIRGRPARVLTRAPAGAYDASAFGVWLDGQRARLGLDTDGALARLVGIRPSMIANWRADRFGPTRPTAERLAAGLGVPADEAYGAAGLLVPAIAGLGLADPQPTPHDVRHTYGTRLADAGLEQHDRMALMGHRDVRSAQRYVHSGDTRFDRARAALARARGTG